MGMKTDNEVAIALIENGYDEWKVFHRMLVKDVDELKKADGRGTMVPCMLAQRRTIERFIGFIQYKKDQKDTTSPWHDAASYTTADFQQFRRSVTTFDNDMVSILENVVGIALTNDVA